MKKRIVWIFVFAVAASHLWAQTPEMFRYQGRLIDGTNLVNATLPMSFKLYDALNSGTLLYTDSGSVTVVDGLYSTMIGDDTVYGSLTNALTNAAVYLELTVNGETLYPRERLVSVPYALNAPIPTPNLVVGDSSAVSNEVVNARWTKNYYANGDITMSDRDSGLMWLYDASFAGSNNWVSAIGYCEDLSYAGYSDWRLPSKVELGFQFYSTEYFIGLPSDAYWTGTPNAYGQDEPWVIDMRNGSPDPGYNVNNHVWPVRGGQ